MPILIAEATDAAIRLALLRHWCREVAQRRSPHDGAPDEVVRLAADLARTLAVVESLRGTRRDVRGLQRRAGVLAVRLAEMGMVPPA
jgi:hypothetical protein